MIVKYTGKNYTLAGKEYIIAPLPLGYLEKNLDKIQKIDEATEQEALTLIIDTVHCSIKRNYPEITRDELVNELLDINNVNDLFATVLGASGFDKGEQEKKLSLPILIGDISMPT